MSKKSGLGMTLTVDDSTGSGVAITNDVGSVSWTMPSGVQDVTGLDKSGHERLLLLADFTITINGFFNDASSHIWAVFKNYRTLAASQTGRTTAIAISGQNLNNEVLYDDFPFTRGADGSFTCAPKGALSDGTVPAYS